MSENTYSPFYREPSKPHQCVHFSDQDGARCRATAMHGEMMCYHHRPDVILPVLENDPFLLENLDDRPAIQRALGQVAARLACNHMDFERARLLLQTINAAMRNLPPNPRAAAPAPTHNAVISTEGDALVAAGEETPHLSSPTRPKPSKSRTRELEVVPVDHPPMKSFDDFPPEEANYLTHTVTSLLCRTEVRDIRPASLSRQQAEDFINGYFQRNRWDPVTLPPDPIPAPDPTPDPATLPTLQATAQPLRRA